MNQRPAALSLLLIACAVGLLWWSFLPQKGQQEQASKSLSNTQMHEALINHHLMMTHRQIELQRQRAQLENQIGLPSVGESILPNQGKPSDQGVDFSQDEAEANAARVLQPQRDYNLTSPDTIIQSEIADTEVQAQQKRRYREEYVRQFKANALRAGYVIEVNDDFVVTSVKKLKPQNQEKLFPE